MFCLKVAIGEDEMSAEARDINGKLLGPGDHVILVKTGNPADVGKSGEVIRPVPGDDIPDGRIIVKFSRKITTATGSMVKWCLPWAHALLKIDGRWSPEKEDQEPVDASLPNDV
jgi:hypothetical protein